MSCWFAATAQRSAHERGCLSATYTSIISCCKPNKVLSQMRSTKFLVEHVQSQSGGDCPVWILMAEQYSRRSVLVLIPLVQFRMVLFRSGQDVPKKLHVLVKVRHSPRPNFPSTDLMTCPSHRRRGLCSSGRQISSVLLPLHPQSTSRSSPPSILQLLRPSWSRQ